MRRTFRGICVGAIAFALYGCISEQEVASWRTALSTVAQETALIEADLATITDPELRARLERTLASMRSGMETLNTKIQNAETGWDLAEIGVGAAATAFPGLSVLIPVLRLLKRRTAQRDKVFESVDAGGGVVDPDAARAVLSGDTGAYAAFKEHKARNGA